MNIIEKAVTLMDESNSITLASINEAGHPRPCVMSKAKSEGIKKVYVSTGTVSNKVRHFKTNQKAGLCVWKGNNCITLTGKVEIIQDTAIKREMWLDWFIEHYPGGPDDPNYCILQFETEEAAVWMDGEYAEFKGEAL